LKYNASNAHTHTHKKKKGIIAAYLMIKEGLSYEESLDDIRRVRPRACPNIGFSLQLKKLERKLALSNNPEA
jgi:protein-tyrosine phosphatase